LVLLPVSILARNTFYLPQAATGVAGDLRFVTQISVSNPTDKQADLTIRFLTNAGNNWTVTTSCMEDQELGGTSSGLEIRLPAGRKYAINRSSNAEIQVGWVHIDSTQNLRISAVYGFHQRRAGGAGFEPLWEAAVLPSQSATELSFAAHQMLSDAVSGVGVRTGYAVSNPNNMDVRVRAKLVNHMGQEEATATFDLPAHGHRSEFTDELFGGSAGFHRGTVYFSCSAPIAGLAMRESKRDPNVVYSTVPVEAESKFKVSVDYDREPNSTQATAQPIEVPIEIYGTASETSDATVSDFYRLPLTSGQRLEVVLLAGVQGSTLNPVMSIRDSEGGVVGTITNLFQGSEDLHGTFTATANGTYFIRVTSTNGTDLTTSFYRLFVNVY